MSESFFATLEKELLALEPLQSRRNTREQVANYIESYYNFKQSNLSAKSGQLHGVVITAGEIERSSELLADLLEADRMRWT